MRSIPTSADSQRVLAAILSEVVHRRVPGRERRGALTGLSEDAVGESLADLGRAGAVVLDDNGRLVAAYPLSTVPTMHTVELGSSVPWANCAIDALAVPMMVGRRGRIVSKCAHCASGISLSVEGRTLLEVQPSSVVVVYGRLADCGDRPSLEVSCPYINFFCSEEHAVAWQRPKAWQGRIVSMQEALALAVDWFSPVIEIYRRHHITS